MADFVFNISLGRIVEFYQRVKLNDPAASNIKVLLLATTGLESDATLKDLDTVTALIAGTTNEATNTGYSRKTLTDSDLTADATPDDGSDRWDLDIPDQTWTGLANDGTGAISKLVLAYYLDAATDATAVPMCCYDFAITPDGSDVTATIAAAGFFRAS